MVSPNIDLLLIAARRHDPGSVERLFAETVEASRQNPGWHGWLWDLRLTQVRAELAFAREEWEAAVAAAADGIDQCRRRTRPNTRPSPMSPWPRRCHGCTGKPTPSPQPGRRSGIARAIEDPAVLLRALDTLLHSTETTPWRWRRRRPA